MDWDSRHLDMRRAPERRDWGEGGAAGILLNLTLAGDYLWDSVYTVNARVGGNEYALQVDTGSADLWLASTSCASAACVNAVLYTPSSASFPTNHTFSLTYLRGSVSGPILWDDVSIGTYDIPSQALAACSSVSSENLAGDVFSGVLGLAPSLDSKIAQEIPPVLDSSPDGASFLSNMYGSTPPPTDQFFSLILARPSDPLTFSSLGLGIHPTGLPDDFDPSMLDWTPVVSSPQGVLFWRVPLMELTVWAGGEPSNLTLPKSIAVPSSSRPIAVLDSGGPTILVPPDVADAVYGAWGLNPAADGNFYPECTLLMNISLTIGTLQYFIHPLDLSLPSPSDPSSPYCIGGIQSITDLSAGDIVLGASFLRNVYSVYTSNASVYLGEGVIPPPTYGQDSADEPHVGLFPLTDPVAAGADFLAQRSSAASPSSPATSSTPNSGSGSNAPTPASVVGGASAIALALPLPALIVIVCCTVLGLLFLVFGLRWFFRRRRHRREAQEDGTGLVLPTSPSPPRTRSEKIALIKASLGLSPTSPLPPVPLTLRLDPARKSSLRTVSDTMGTGTLHTMHTGGTGSSTFAEGEAATGWPWSSMERLTGDRMHGRYPSPSPVRSSASRATSLPRTDRTEGDEDRPPPPHPLLADDLISSPLDIPSQQPFSTSVTDFSSVDVVHSYPPPRPPAPPRPPNHATI